MYRISKDPDGVILICHDRPHVEHIDAFDESVNSRRTQAARAMQSHSCHEQGAGSVLKPVPEGRRAHGHRGRVLQWRCQAVALSDPPLSSITRSRSARPTGQRRWPESNDSLLPTGT